MHPRQTAVAVAAGVAVAVMAWQSWAGASLTFGAVFAATVSGLASGAIFAVAAGGLVVTYVTSGIFNVAQGAIGMMMAFIYWELRVNRQLPTPLCLLLVLGVAAPLFGAGCEVVIMRSVRDAPVVSQIMVTVGLMLALMGIAGAVWPSASVSRTLPPFFGNRGFAIDGTVVTWHRTIAICVAVALAVFMRLLLFRTRFGTALRACVDNRDLASLHGARPNRASMAAWALGSTMAAMAGILLGPEIPFAVEALTLLIVDAFAAAILGRLRSLPLTFLGAVVLGLLNSYAVTFLNLSGRWTFARQATPTVFLFVVLLMLPQTRIEPGRRRGATASSLRVPSLTESAFGLTVLVGVLGVLAVVLPLDQVERFALGISTALIMLSLVPLTGWAGEVSLAPMTFAGLGAFALAKTAGSAGLLGGLLAATLIAVPAGLLMAAPAVRLRGLYMALASLAFARMAELLLFPQPELFGISGSGTVAVPPLSVFGARLTSPRVLLVATAVAFALVGMALVGVRRSRYGRRLIALRDSPAACTTVGINVFRTKLSVYAFSSALAGLAGAFFGLYRGEVGTDDFTMLASLPIVLLLVIGGVGTVSGALFGGLVSVLIQVVQATWHLSFLNTLNVLGPGLAAIGIGQNLDGAAAAIGASLRPLLHPRLRGEGSPDPADLGLSRPFTATDVGAVETYLSLPEEYRHDAARP